jgi:hypothetical protein
VNATTEGVVRAPSWLLTMVGLPPSMAATALFVVPRSTPTTCEHASRCMMILEVAETVAGLLADTKNDVHACCMLGQVTCMPKIDL